MGLDTVEMIMEWEEAFNIEIPDRDTDRIRTPKDAIDYICGRLCVTDARGGSCLSMRAFHQLRNAVCQDAGVPRASMRPRARLNDVTRTDRRKAWRAICAAGGWKRLTGPAYVPGLGFFNITVEEVTYMLLARNARTLRKSDEPWTRSQIRCVVRATVSDTTRARNFKDEERFVDIC